MDQIKVWGPLFWYLLGVLDFCLVVVVRVVSMVSYHVINRNL